jgi:hypothetical protein
MFGQKPTEPVPLPRPDIDWEDPWHQIEESMHQLGLQRELKTEIGPQHPLWGSDPVVFGRHGGTDDVVVALSGERYAIVHLVWHGHIDAHPRNYPATTIYPDLEGLKRGLAEEARQWKRDHG